jgi:hypothetical protein
MVVYLEKIIPFGRSLDEYVKLFNLTETDLHKAILGIGDGPASFNAEGTKLGYQITSIDPIYSLTANQIQNRFYEVVDNVITQVEQTPNDWVWEYHKSPDDLRKNREKALALFCDDYELGKQKGRYKVGELPCLNYSDQTYELGLCSHLLFLYSEQLDIKFHIDAVCEMLRVCQEVRIFPLITLNLQPSPYLPIVVETLEGKGYQCELQPVIYELQRGGNTVLKISKAT